MRGFDTTIESLFTMRTLEGFVPADHPLRAMLLQVFYSIRSERQLMKQTQYNENYKNRGIGMIAHGKAVQRDMLKHIVLKYFFSNHQQVLVKKNAKDRTLFMSHPPSSRARTGRPRSKDDMALPSDMSMACASPI